MDRVVGPSLIVILLLSLHQGVPLAYPIYKGTSSTLSGIHLLLSSILQIQNLERSSALLILDESPFSEDNQEMISQLWAPFGVGIFAIGMGHNGSNSSQNDFNRVIRQAHKLRRESWDVTVIVVSMSPSFLSELGALSAKLRLLAPTTKMVVVTRLTTSHLWRLCNERWTFSMMNTVFVNVAKSAPVSECDVLAYKPYTANGPSLEQVGRWRVKRGLSPQIKGLFPSKYSNFHGAEVNVSALDYKPVWYTVTEQARDGTVTEKLTGMDYLLLETMAKALNFKIHLLNVSSWGMALERVVERVSFITPAYHAILLERLERFDYTIGFTYVRISFSMAKPQITPNWLSLYYPLSNEVWASILAALVVMPLILFQVTRLELREEPFGSRNFGWVTLTLIGSILGQALGEPRANASRVLMTAWLMFAFIIGAAYRGNLTASLTLPKYPPRAETIQELVDTAKEVTMESWGKDYKTSFKQSGIAVMEKLADLMVVGPSLKEGLRQSLIRKQGQLDTRHSLEVAISEHFTNRDGTSKFYMGRETVLPGLSGWPIPHDAPFKPDFDWCIQAAIEAGLYDKWTEDMLSLTRQETRKKKREFERQKLEQGLSREDLAEVAEEDSADKRALSLSHMQGPFMLYVILVALGFVGFALEVILHGRVGQ